MKIQEYDQMRKHEDSHWWYAHLRKRLLKAMRSVKGDSPPWGQSPKILDIGCGTGGNMAFLSRVFPGAEISGLDLNAHALELAQTRALKNLSLASAHQIPFSDAFFDAAICTDVLYHQNADEQKLLAEARRVLKPEGFLFVNVPAFESLRGRHDEAVQTRRRYRSPELKSLLEAAGFRIVFVSYWNALLFPVLWIWRRFSHPSESSDVQSSSKWGNALLHEFLNFEMAFFPNPGLPFGTSLFAAAIKD